MKMDRGQKETAFPYWTVTEEAVIHINTGEAWLSLVSDQTQSDRPKEKTSSLI